MHTWAAAGSSGTGETLIKNCGNNVLYLELYVSGTMMAIVVHDTDMLALHKCLIHRIGERDHGIHVTRTILTMLKGYSTQA